MIEHCQRILNEIDDSINELTYRQGNSLETYESAISLVLKKIKEVKKYVLKTGFKDEDEEILFFKIYKPSIISKLIYYNAIYKIEAKKPLGGKEVIEVYLNNELLELKRFYYRNNEFCKYYRTKSTYLDHKYFVRGGHDIKLSLDTFSFEADPEFSTSHDYKIAKIIANDRLQAYLEDQVKNNQAETFDRTPLKWTGSKSAATELIYGLYLQGVFNNGNTDIVTIVRFFEQIFGINLGDFYHTFLEIKSRKINRTKFIDSLHDALIKKMDEQE